MSKERRSFSRIGFHSTVTIGIQGKVKQAELVDISLKGALIRMADGESIENGEPCFLQLNLEPDRIVVTTDALIVYSQEEMLGIKFENLDLESMTHLRRLIELNLGDSEQIQQELFFLANPPSKS